MDLTIHEINHLDNIFTLFDIIFFIVIITCISAFIMIIRCLFYRHSNPPKYAVFGKTKAQFKACITMIVSNFTKVRRYYSTIIRITFSVIYNKRI